MDFLTTAQPIGLVLIILGYLAGSVSAAIVVCSVLGLSDPRQSGSKNPGATNVMRLHGKNPAILTLCGDVLKGVIPILIARLSGMPFEVQILVGLAAFLGHLYPVYFRFKGGKGVATAFGVLFTLDWRLGMACGVTWMAIFAWQRISSLAALIAFFALPMYSWLINHSPTLTAVCLVISGLIFWRHRSNIQSLLNGDGG